MSHRTKIIPSIALLIACLAVLPACKKKPPAGGAGDPATGAPGTPAAVNTGYVSFVHLNAKEVRDSAIFTEVKQAFTKAGGTAADWDKLESEAGIPFGIKLTDIDAVTACLTEIPERALPKFILIIAANKPIDKAGVNKVGGKPDARGFYKDGNALVHFADDKTLVVLHPDLAQQYLDGYAKDRTGWPLTADLSKAAAGHTLYVSANIEKIPREGLGKRDVDTFASLLATKTVTFTADLKGKELHIAARGTYPDVAAAGKAKEKVQELLAAVPPLLEVLTSGKGATDLGAFLPAVKEAQRAVKDIKIEVAGSDLTAVGSYRANFDIGPIITEAVLKVGEAATRMKGSNNLKQIGLALHNYHDANGMLPIHGIGPKHTPLKKATDKPLLSWRVAILPYIEQDNLYRQFKHDEPWDSEHNKKLIDKMPITFAPTTKPGKPGFTHMQMVVGPNAMQPGATLQGILDGMSNTIAVVEAAEPVIWTKPDDVMIPGKEMPKDLKKKFGGLHKGGFHVTMWDGSVRYISDTISEKTLWHAITPNGGEVLGSDW